MGGCPGFLGPLGLKLNRPGLTVTGADIVWDYKRKFKKKYFARIVVK